MQEETSKNKTSQIFILLFIALVISVIIIYFPKTKNNTKQTEEISKGPSIEDKDQDSQLAILRTGSDIKIPNINSETVVQSSKFPQDILGLFGQNISNLETNSVNFDNGKIGFTVDFNVSLTSRGVLEAVAVGRFATTWQVLNATFTDDVSQTDLENGEYQATIESKKLSNSSSSVHIILIKK